MVDKQRQLKILNTVTKNSEKLDKIIQMMNPRKVEQTLSLEQMPPNLIPTFLAAQKLAPCTAQMVATYLGKVRVTSGQNLNRLVELGYLIKTPNKRHNARTPYKYSVAE